MSTAPPPRVIPGRVTPLADGFSVRRLLPAAQQRAVGPFVFFDHFGPVTLAPDQDADVGAHPHIGLATVTYLLEGSYLHRDSLGTAQIITPGAVNWMTAGRGIVHSERTPAALRNTERRLHGLQLWVALPPDHETMAPAFQHVSAAEIPHLRGGALGVGVAVRVLVGTAWGVTSPVRTVTPTLYLDVTLAPDVAWWVPPLALEMAIYAPEQPLQVGPAALAPQHLCVLDTSDRTLVRAGPHGARLLLIGGAPLVQPVRLWWNYVSTDPARIAAAAHLWAADGFATIDGETGRIAGPPWPGDLVR